MHLLDRNGIPHRTRALHGVRTVLLLTVVLSTLCCAAEIATVRAELAPSGRLRVGLFNKNPVYVTEDVRGNELQGVAPELGRELAKRLEVDFEAIRYPNIIGLLAGAENREWDVAFVGVDPSRAIDFEYAGTYMDEDYTYLVSAESPIQQIEDADRTGHRIVVAQGGIGDLYLTRTLKHAALLRVPEINNAALELMLLGRADAVVWGRPALRRLSATLPRSRVVEGRFYAVPLGIAVAKGRPLGTAYVTRFIEEAKASGFVNDAIRRWNVH